MEITKPHVALLASPGMGHLIPVLELGKRLVIQNNHHATIFVVANDTSSEQLSNLVNSPDYDILDIVLLPVIDISGIVCTDASLVTQIAVMIHESIPALRSTISAMKYRPTALIVDLFGTEAMAVADEFEMLKYMFIASNAWFVAVTIYAPALDKKVLQEEHVNQKKPLKIPGCSSVRFEDTLEALLDPYGPMYDGFLQVGMDMSKADGILVNTWEDLESKTLAALRDFNMLRRMAKAPVYPVGPLARSVASSPVSGSHVILDWLDKQPHESVIYVSFGSGGTLSSKQTMELAWGLEQSKQRFIWVVRPPLDHDVFDSYLTAGSGALNTAEGALDYHYLPEGFLIRTRDVGLVVPMWAPQPEILAHPSVGGFLTHCGWNSTMESIVNGVPMIVWPLYAEQKMNATMLTEELRVAIRSKEVPSEKSVVGRGEIEMMVWRIVAEKQGHAIRNRVKELKHSAQKALINGGSSYNSLSKIAHECENSLQFTQEKAEGA